jgi:hypothetical protein
MKKLLVILALALLLVPAIVMAVPSYCTWNGDPSLRYGFNQVISYNSSTGVYTLRPLNVGYNQPGPDYGTTWAGGVVTQIVAPYDASPTWVPSCAITGAPDTFACQASATAGWTVSGSPALGTRTILANGGGYLWAQYLTIQAPCNALVGDVGRIIVRMVYWNTKDNLAAPECGDCNDPNLRPGDGKLYYNADTLFLTIVQTPPPLTIKQDSLTLVDQGQTEAYVPFSICNTDACNTTYNYNIKSKGHVGAAINTTGSVSVPGGTCKDVYGVINAGTATVCALDTLKIIAWGGVPLMYDTCVQIIHVISPQPVPLFTAPVVTILVLALILAAAVFMRRRAVSRA